LTRAQFVNSRHFQPWLDVVLEAMRPFPEATVAIRDALAQWVENDKTTNQE
jgi:hypothetical protein